MSKTAYRPSNVEYLRLSEPKRMRLLGIPFVWVMNGSTVITAPIGLTKGHATRRGQKALNRLHDLAALS